MRSDVGRRNDSFTVFELGVESSACRTCAFSLAFDLRLRLDDLSYWNFIADEGYKAV